MNRSDGSGMLSAVSTCGRVIVCDVVEMGIIRAQGSSRRSNAGRENWGSLVLRPKCIKVFITSQRVKSG